MKNIKKELPFITIALLPFIYLALIWKSLPEKVPLRWNGAGEVDYLGEKIELIFSLFLLTGSTYFIFLFVPKIDPKNKLKKMGNKLHQLRFIFSIFMSILGIYIVYSLQQTKSEPAFIFALLGLLFAVLGNYFKTLRPNYFIGIRTPWTLESEEVWKKTHSFSGKLWFAVGLLIFILCLVVPTIYASYIFISLTLTITVVSIIYSYLAFKKSKKQ